MDADNWLRQRTLARLNKVIDSFKTRFPDLRMAIHPTRRPADLEFRKVGFWLFNFCSLSAGEIPGDREETPEVEPRSRYNGKFAGGSNIRLSLRKRRAEDQP